MTDSDTKIIKFTITRLLARREHSQYELLNKLILRDFNRQLCVEWINKFCKHNLQSDIRYAEAFTRIRSNKGVGESRIRNELKQNQITQEIIDTAIAKQNIDWFELAKTVYLKKYVIDPRTDAQADWKTQQKQKKFLYYRGFSQDQIQYALESNEN
jgi:regulatory protein